MSVTSVVVGAVTSSGATFVAKVDGGGPVRVAVADNAGMSGPVFTASQAVDGQGVAKVAITGLAAATPFWYQVEDNGTVDTAVTGRFRTHPTSGLPASFTIGVASCAGGVASVPGVGSPLAADRISNHPVFTTIRNRAVAEGWAGFAHLGDLHYYDLGSGDHGIVGGGSLANYRTAYDDVLAQPTQAALYRDVPWMSFWDDHDYGPNNSDGTLATKANALQVYGERVPHYPLDGGNGIYQAPDPIGRVQVIGSDVRFNRSPNGDPDGASKTMLGAAQKAWLANLLATSTAEVLVWFMSSQWMWPDPVSGVDTWAVFGTERDELVQMFGDHGWLGRMCMVYGDRHAAGIDSGGFNQWGNFPVLVASSLDSNTGVNQVGLYDTLDDTNGRNQYGTVTVTDLGSVIQVGLSAWRGTGLLGTHQFSVVVEQASPIASGALLRTLGGSHTPVVEARVVTGHPTGDDPAGTEVDVLGGDVTYDGTAEIRGTVQLDVLGVSDRGQSTFPRLVGDLFAPYGAELFVRYGLDLGGAGIIWTPLGYFRIEEPDQSDAPYGPLSISGSDRMAGLIEANLLAPRSYPASTTIGAIVVDLVTDVYPAAAIAWDDTSDQTPIGRVLVVEESRYEAVKDIADSRGKIVFWDGEGVLRIESAPAEDDPVWQVKAGRGGALIGASRRISRHGIANAVIVVGQGADDQPAVRATAFDNNPQSPTYFHGDFGQVPRKVESPLLSNVDRALESAIAILRRSLGAPYQVSFTAFCNPTVRPFDPVRVVYRDGNREMHVLQRVKIPLTPGQVMTGTTRHKILAAIGSLS